MTDFKKWFAARARNPDRITLEEAFNAGKQSVPSVPDGWREAAVAWEVCASIHREYARGKDPFFSTRQGDFAKHAQDARDMLVSAQKPEGE